MTNLLNYRYWRNRGFTQCDAWRMANSSGTRLQRAWHRLAQRVQQLRRTA